MFRTTIAAFLIATPAAAADADGFYTKLFGGVSSLQDTDITIGAASEAGIGFSSGTFAGGAVGFGYGDSPWAAELEFAYRSGESDSGTTAGGDFASTALMINGVRAFNFDSAWTPYAGAGLGYVTEIDFDVPGVGEFSDRGGVAWQVFGGVSYAVSARVSVFGELRYFDAGSVSLDGSGGPLDADYSSVDLAAGVSFSF